MAQNWEPKWSEKHAQWIVSFSVKGRQIRRRLGIRDRSSKAIARREAKRLHDEAWQQSFEQPEPTGTPFFEAAKAYFEAGGEARFLPPLIRYFGRETCCEDIGPVEMSAAAMSIYPGRARSTIRRQVDVPVNAVIAFAAGKRRQPTGDQPRARWLLPEEAERLIANGGRITPMIAFLLGTGCRTGEMFAGRVDDLQNGAFTVRAEIEGAGKSSAAARTIPLPHRALDLIGETPEEGALFLTPKGQPYKMRVKGGGQIAAAFKTAREAAGLGLDVTPHVLRHTWATWHYAQNKDLLLLMAHGGWAKVDMAMRYTKLAPPQLAEQLFEYGWSFQQDASNIYEIRRFSVKKSI